jgi:hypothetical protein
MVVRKVKWCCFKDVRDGLVEALPDVSLGAHLEGGNDCFIRDRDDAEDKWFKHGIFVLASAIKAISLSWTGGRAWLHVLGGK